MSHSTEIRHRAEHLFIVKGLTRAQVAKATGVCERQLTNWSTAYHWKEKREEYREAFGAIERDRILLRSRMLAKALETLDPKTASAVAKLEACARGEKEPEDLSGLPSGEEEPNPAESPKETILALQRIVARKVRTAHDRPETLTADGIRDLKETLELIDKLKSKYHCEENQRRGLSEEAAEEIRRKILGIE